jgi:hypothetical protein
MERRGKQTEKHKSHVGVTQCYDTYKNDFLLVTVETKVKNKTVIKKKLRKNSKYFLTQTEYSNILTEFNEAIGRELIFNAFNFKLPYRLGNLVILKNKAKIYVDEDDNVVNCLPVDWKETLLLWEENPIAKQQKKLVRCLNDHFNGYVAKFKYNKASARYNNKSAYSFIPCRTLKIALAKAIKNPDLKIDFYLN